MGVKNLFNFVDHACKNAHIDEFVGATIGIDMSCIMFRGLFHIDTMQYISNIVNMLLLKKCKL